MHEKPADPAVLAAHQLEKKRFYRENFAEQITKSGMCICMYMYVRMNVYVCYVCHVMYVCTS